MTPVEDCATFPLKAITDLFPPEFKGSLHKQPSEHVEVHIPRTLIRPQLAEGAVRITFAQLRAAAPEIFFRAEDAPPADSKVLLPLELVLRQMMPSRRDDQRMPTIPVNIPSIFLKAGKPNQALPKGAPAGGNKEAWYSQRLPTYETKPEPAPASAPPPPSPSADANRKKPFQPLMSMSERPRRTSEPGAAAPVQRLSAPPDSFALPLAAVLSVLPPEICRAVNGADAKTAAFFVPMAEFDSRMRTGKLVFKWGQLRNWCNMELSTLAESDMDIELPLAEVTPLFMAACRKPETRKQVEVDTRIPDVFSKSKPLPSAPPAPSPAIRTKPDPVPVASPSRPAPVQSATGLTAPAQIIQRIRALNGVRGAFIATADGLLVAGDVPEANENVLAAFAPTVFAQLTKYADMARLGLPETIDIHLTGATVHVRKAGKLFLGVLFPSGSPLPVPELTEISNALQPQAS